MVNPDNTIIEVPGVLRDLLADLRLHPRQPYYEVIEEAVLFWLECGAPRRPFTRDCVEMRRRDQADPMVLQPRA